MVLYCDVMLVLFIPVDFTIEEIYVDWSLGFGGSVLGAGVRGLVTSKMCTCVPALDCIVAAYLVIAIGL